MVYVDGKPLKRDYRRFKLKDMEGPDDYASMEQVLTRRFRRYLDGDEKFSDKPDLLLIDGGHEHVKVARRVLETLGLDIPAFGMVKDDRHRTRALVHPDGREIGIQSIPPLRHRIPPSAPGGTRKDLRSGQDTRGRGEAPPAAAEALQNGEGHPGRLPGAAPGGGPQEHRPGGV